MKVISVFFFTIRRSSVSVITLSSGFSTFSWNSSLASRSPPEQEVRATPAATAAPEARAVRRVIARMGIVLSGSGRAAERDPFSRVLNACLLAAVEGGLLRLHEVGEPDVLERRHEGVPLRQRQLTGDECAAWLVQVFAEVSADAGQHVRFLSGECECRPDVVDRILGHEFG